MRKYADCISQIMTPLHQRRFQRLIDNDFCTSLAITDRMPK